MRQIQVTRSRLPDWPLWSVVVAIAMAVSLTAFSSLALYALAGLLRLATGANFSLTSPGMNLAATLAMDASVVAAVLLSARILEGRLRLSGFGFVPALTTRRRTVLLCAATWLSFLLFTVAWKQLIPPSEKQNIVEHLGAHDSNLLWAGTFLMLGIVAPICEEIFFRGFIFTALWRRIPLAPSAIVTGALFAVVHISSSAKLLVVALGFFGAMLCVLRAITGSLIPCIAVHALNNSMSYGFSEHLSFGVMLAMAAGAVATTVAIGRLLAARAYTQTNGSDSSPPGPSSKETIDCIGPDGNDPGPARGGFGAGGG